MLQSAAWEGLCVAEEPASTAAALPGSLGACWTPATGSPYYTCSFFYPINLCTFDILILYLLP